MNPFTENDQDIVGRGRGDSVNSQRTEQTQQSTSDATDIEGLDGGDESPGVQRQGTNDTLQNAEDMKRKLDEMKEIDETLEELKLDIIRTKKKAENQLKISIDDIDIRPSNSRRPSKFRSMTLVRKQSSEDSDDSQKLVLRPKVKRKSILEEKDTVSTSEEEECDELGATITSELEQHLRIVDAFYAKAHYSQREWKEGEMKKLMLHLRNDYRTTQTPRARSRKKGRLYAVFYIQRWWRKTRAMKSLRNFVNLRNRVREKMMKREILGIEQAILLADLLPDRQSLEARQLQSLKCVLLAEETLKTTLEQILDKDPESVEKHLRNCLLRGEALGYRVRHEPKRKSASGRTSLRMSSLGHNRNKDKALLEMLMQARGFYDLAIRRKTIREKLTQGVRRNDPKMMREALTEADELAEQEKTVIDSEKMERFSLNSFQVDKARKMLQKFSHQMDAYRSLSEELKKSRLEEFAPGRFPPINATSLQLKMRSAYNNSVYRGYNGERLKKLSRHILVLRECICEALQTKEDAPWRALSKKLIEIDKWGQRDRDAEALELKERKSNAETKSSILGRRASSPVMDASRPKIRMRLEQLQVDPKKDPRQVPDIRDLPDVVAAKLLVRVKERLDRHSSSLKASVLSNKPERIGEVLYSITQSTRRCPIDLENALYPDIRDARGIYKVMSTPVRKPAKPMSFAAVTLRNKSLDITCTACQALCLVKTDEEARAVKSASKWLEKRTAQQIRRADKSKRDRKKKKLNSNSKSKPSDWAKKIRRPGNLRANDVRSLRAKAVELKGYDFLRKLFKARVMESLSRHLGAAALASLPAVLRPALALTRGQTVREERAARASWIPGSKFEAKRGVEWVKVTLKDVDVKDDIETLHCKVVDGESEGVLMVHRWARNETRPTSQILEEDAHGGSSGITGVTYENWYVSAKATDLVKLQVEILGLIRQLTIHPCTSAAALTPVFITYHAALALLPLSRSHSEEGHNVKVSTDVEARARAAARYLVDVIRTGKTGKKRIIEGLDRMSAECYEFYVPDHRKTINNTKDQSTLQTHITINSSVKTSDPSTDKAESLSGSKLDAKLRTSDLEINIKLAKNDNKSLASPLNSTKSVPESPRWSSDRKNIARIVLDEQKREANNDMLRTTTDKEANGLSLSMLFILMRWYKKVETHTELVALITAVKSVE